MTYRCQNKLIDPHLMHWRDNNLEPPHDIEMGRKLSLTSKKQKYIDPWDMENYLYLTKYEYTPNSKYNIMFY